MEQIYSAAKGFPSRCCGASGRRLYVLLLLVLATLLAMCAPGNETLAKSKPVSWKPIDDALLRVNDVPVKDWSVYQAGKKSDPLLLQMGNRFLLIEIHEQQLFELEASKIERKPEELRFDPSDRPANPLATSDWMESDIGAAFRISAKIDSEGRVLDLQLMHPIDLGQTPVRGAAPRRR